MPGQYASQTSVAPGRSRDEIERTLERFVASKQAWLRYDVAHSVTIAFERDRLAYRLSVVLPALEDCRHTPTGQWRSDSATTRAHDQETRRRFRSLALYLKAVLEAIDTGIIDARTALLPHMLLASGETVAEQADREIEAALLTGEVPGMRLALAAPRERARA